MTQPSTRQLPKRAVAFAEPYYDDSRDSESEEGEDDTDGGAAETRGARNVETEAPTTPGMHDKYAVPKQMPDY